MDLLSIKDKNPPLANLIVFCQNKLALFAHLAFVRIGVLRLASCQNDQSQVVRRLEGIPYSLAMFLADFRSWTNETWTEDGWRDLLCMHELEQFGLGLRSDQRWALQLYDSWGKMPSGLERGNSFTPGSFEQCLEFSLHNSAASFDGHHCTVRLNLRYVESSLDEFWIGICVPNSCEARFVKRMVDSFAEEYSYLKVPDFRQEDFCYRDDPNWSLSGTAIAAITIFAIIVAVTLACTIVEVLGFILQRPVHKLVKELSLYYKLFTLFKTTPKSEEKTDTMDCINGIRSFMMLQIISHHVHSAIRTIPTTNHLAREEFFESAFGILGYRVSALSADIFLVLSAVLLTYNVLKELTATEKVCLPRLYFRRIVRILPPYGFLIFFVVAFAEYFGEGPLYQYYVHPMVDACTDNWWSALLFVQNYVHPDRMCLPHTWYLSVDMQLYLISPLFIYLLWKFGKRSLFGPLLVALLSMACVFTTFMVNDFVLNPPMSPDREFQRDRLTHYPTHARMAVWFCGIVFGYLLFRTRGKRVVSSQLILVGGSIAATALTGVIMFCAHEIYKPREADPLGDAFYEALHRVAWVICIMWLIFMCVNEHASALGHFLAWTFWQPVARLSYNMYLIHYVVIVISFSGMLRQPFYFSAINLQYVNFGVIGLTGALSLVWWLLIEQPFQVTVRYVRERLQKSKQ
ncbi:O-acyltransferase like protein [Aedes aegypti]|uniref:Nose resistant-to-fluoxetine protein N-terminal domain-containing protein n=1 Tax=Aedes aegypti TaxID=7159 RepID=A0A903UGQ6_AEDAE|nr:O-acyltransferase like protein [Aedes aegypti]